MTRLPLLPAVFVLCLLAGVPARAQTAPQPVVATLSLDEAVARFRDDSPTAQQLAGRVAEAQAAVKLASAAALPIVAAQGAFTRNSDEAIISLSDVFQQIQDQLPVEIDISGLPGDLVLQPLQQWTGGASVTVPLLAPQAWVDIGAAKRMAHAAQGATTAVLQQAEAGLVSAAWMAQAAEEALAASVHAVEAAERHRDSARNLMQIGTGTELAVLVAETELSRRQSERVQAVANLDKARRGVGALLGVAGPVEVTVSDRGNLPQSGDAAAAIAVDHRPDLQAALDTRDAAGRSVASALWRHAPTVAGSAALFGSDIEYPTGEKTGWKLGLTATWVLFDGGARYGLLDRGRAQQMQAEGSVAQLTLDAERQARDAVAALEVAIERRRLAEQAAETALKAEGSAERLYDAGLLSSLDAVDAVQRRLDAEVMRAGAVAQVGVARAQLQAAMGRGWE